MNKKISYNLTLYTTVRYNYKLTNLALTLNDLTDCNRLGSDVESLFYEGY